MAPSPERERFPRESRRGTDRPSGDSIPPAVEPIVQRTPRSAKPGPIALGACRVRAPYQPRRSSLRALFVAFFHSR
jgi:hypothetical protein